MAIQCYAALSECPANRGGGTRRRYCGNEATGRLDLRLPAKMKLPGIRPCKELILWIPFS